MLTAIERMAGATNLPLIAMPNAGMPRAVDGRNIYLCSPEYMASFARKLIKAGVQFVGGCCGTTPSHIRSMKSSLRAMGAQEVAHHPVKQSPGCVRDRAGAAGRAIAPRQPDCQRHLCHHGGDGAAQGHCLRTGARGRPDAGAKRGPHHQCPRSVPGGAAHERAKSVYPDSAADRHGNAAALHLSRPQFAEHPVRPAGGFFDRA